MRFVGKAILAAYNADTTLAALAPLYRSRAADTEKMPYVVFHYPITSHPIYRVDRYGEMVVVQFAIWSANEDKTDAIFTELKNCFDEAVLTYDGSYESYYCLRGESHGGEDPTGRWYINVDYTLKIMQP